MKVCVFFLSFTVSINAMDLAKKESLYFALLPREVRGVVYSYYKNPHCTHKGLQDRFDQVVYKESKKKKRLEKATSLLLLGANPNAEVVCLWRPLYLAAGHSDLKMVQLLLRAGATPDYDKSPYDLRPIHGAAENNNVKIGRLLLGAGAKLDYQCAEYDHLWKHPLYRTSLKGSLEMMRILHKAGTTTSSLLWKGCLKQAVQAGHAGIIHYIIVIAQGASPNSSMKELGTDHTPLQIAARNNRLEAVRALLKLGAKLTTEKGWQPITYAAQHNNLEMAQLLVDAGARMKIDHYENVLHFAVDHQNPAMVQLVLNNLKKFEKNSHGYWNFQEAFKNAFEEAERLTDSKLMDKTILNMLLDYKKAHQSVD